MASRHGLLRNMRIFRNPSKPDVYKCAVVIILRNNVSLCATGVHTIIRIYIIYIYIYIYINGHILIVYIKTFALKTYEISYIIFDSGFIIRDHDTIRDFVHHF